MNDLDKLATDLRAAAEQAAQRAHQVVKDHSTQLRNQWRNNARRSAGAHGKHYPASITIEETSRTGVIAYEVGPDSAMEQGGMSFEYGSSNQPPHWDGLRAAVQQEPKFIKDIKDITKDFL